MHKIFFFFFLLLIFIPGQAQRPMEKLDRSVVAQKVSNGVYVNWRIPSDEWYNTSYKLYRDGTLIHTTTATGASNFLDAAGTVNSKYSVSAVKNGQETAQSAQAGVLARNFLEIPLRDIKKFGKQGYYPNDATTADLDGDGQYEIIIKRLKRPFDLSTSDYSYFEAYKLDGTFMWAIDCGPNITMDVEMNIAAYDFDGDGKAEVFMRTSDNTIFGLDINNQGGVSVGDRDGDGTTNYRAYTSDEGFMNAGPEYLSLIDGVTGKELDWVNFIPRGNSNDWGDGYGHRANKFFFGAPYLDGKKPSLFIGRGIYTQTKMQTYDVVNKKLVPRWFWESGSSSNRQQGKWDDAPKSYFGQGYHNYTIADVDDDGKDEINWGSMSVDDDGKPLYSTELGHGDAQHYGDFDPYRKGQEMFACNESRPGTNLRDAKTGKLLYRKVAPSDVGRAGAGNISDAYKGAEVWGGGVGLSATDKVELTHFGVAENYSVYWDGDLLQEILDHSGFSTSTGVGYGKISKFNGMGNITTLLSADAFSCNYTKGTPCLQADIMGDWREEAIWWRTDSLALRIYTTPYQTNHRIYTLMHDHQYRQAICWQMCGYNQPPHTSFYLGGDFPVPVPAKSTNGKLVFAGKTADLDASVSNFYNGDDAQGLIAGNAVAISFSNGKNILLDERSPLKVLNLKSNLEPGLLMIAGNENYTIQGTGSFGGSMMLDKTGEGTTIMQGNHTYTGKTDVWEGNLFIHGTLTSSPVTVRRHAGFGGKLTVGNNITTEHNAAVYPGGNAVTDTMIVSGNLNLVSGAKLVMDLSDNPNVPDKQAVRSNKTNDLIQVNGIVNIAAGSILAINEIADSISEGKYLIMKANAVTGNLAGMKIQGAGGKSVTLSYDATSKGIYLTVVGTRSAAAVVWTGKTNNTWNIGKAANWSKDGFDDIFVNNDSVMLDDSGFNRTINVTDSVFVADLTVNNSVLKSYTIMGTGNLNGSMSLSKFGPGALYVNNRNAFTGKVIINEGSLVMQYAPSSINNGGIGTNITDPTYLVLRDSSILQVTTANESTDRGLTMAGDNGGLMNVNVALYWNGLITGTKLTKFGTGTLYLGSNNQNLNETELRSGTIRLNTNASVAYGVGKKITLYAGTLDTKNDIGAYLTSSHHIEIPSGSTVNVNAAARCEYNGNLSGAGVLNWRADFIRAYLNGNWSGFSGRINLLKNTANSTYEDKFIVNSNYGYPNATVDIASGVIMCYKNGTADNGTTTLKIGMLTGAAGSVYHNAGLEVGGLNTSGTYGGIFTGVTAIKKVGAGAWTLSGANTNTGITLVNEGILNVTGSLGTGTVTVANNASMSLSGSTGGNCVVSAGGTLSLTGSVTGSLVSSGILKGTGTVAGAASMSSGSETQPGASLVGTLTFSNSLVLRSGSKLTIQINGGAAGTSDKLVVAGTLTCSGTLDLVKNSGTFVEGAIYKIIEAGAISGTFETVNLPLLDTSLAWDLSELYTSGTVKIIKNLSTVVANELQSGFLENPTSGIFRIKMQNQSETIQLQLCNVNGQVLSVNKYKPENELIVVDLRAMPVGVYFFKIRNNEGLESVLKAVKR